MLHCRAEILIPLTAFSCKHFHATSGMPVFAMISTGRRDFGSLKIIEISENRDVMLVGIGIAISVKLAF